MKLSKVHIREFKSIWDSNPFKCDRVTALVGKNEAGKTAVLQALYRLNPLVDGDGEFDVTDDYPRAENTDYKQAVDAKERSHATVIEATFSLEAAELEAIEAYFGRGALSKNEITVSKGYELDDSGRCKRMVAVPVDEAQIVANLIKEYDLHDVLDQSNVGTIQALKTALVAAANKAKSDAAAAVAAVEQIAEPSDKAKALEEAKTLEESEQAKALRERVTALSQKKLDLHIWETYLEPVFPQFLYFDEYYQMRGNENIEALIKRKNSGILEKSDLPMLGLIELARLDLAGLLTPERTQDLKNQLQGASNHLTNKILQYWSQNRHLRISFDVRQGLPKDPEGMRDGHNIWGEIYDTKHLATTGIGTRSTGFVWFFSFLAWYSSEKKKNSPLVLLLDEPGLSLHGKAQADLLRYFEAEIVTNPKHQLIYTTHSPFMIDPTHFERVRIVQDKGIDSNENLPKQEDGTKVFIDVLEAGPDSLFPLQGALGYDIHQTLFIGPNSLVVEGVSDLLYIQTISAALEAKGRRGLSSDWTITPVGGSDKIPTFVALLGAQTKLNIAALIDYQKSDQQTIENLYRRKLLTKNRVLTYADFTGTSEADVEDMFDAEFYIGLVIEEFDATLAAQDLKSQHPRIVVRLEAHFQSAPLPNGAKFNHYRPARLLASRTGGVEVPEDTLARFESAFARLNSMLSR